MGIQEQTEADSSQTPSVSFATSDWRAQLSCALCLTYPASFPSESVGLLLGRSHPVSTSRLMSRDLVHSSNPINTGQPTSWPLLLERAVGPTEREKISFLWGQHSGLPPTRPLGHCLPGSQQELMVTWVQCWTVSAGRRECLSQRMFMCHQGLRASYSLQILTGELVIDGVCEGI